MISNLLKYAATNSNVLVKATDKIAHEFHSPAKKAIPASFNNLNGLKDAKKARLGGLNSGYNADKPTFTPWSPPPKKPAKPLSFQSTLNSVNLTTPQMPQV